MILAILFTSSAVKSEDAAMPCLCNELEIKSPDWRLYLYAKDPATWQVINGGAWGELNINHPSGKFRLEVHGLLPKTEYALVRYRGPALAAQIVLRFQVNDRGSFKSSGVWREWSEKFWVVLGSDLQENPADFKPGTRATPKDWHPAQYLFESEALL